MRYFLSRRTRPIVSQLAKDRTLCAFDFDGTLAAIVDDPKCAAMRASTHALLRELALLYPCIVISGRARKDVMEKLSGAPGIRVVGNHGADALESTAALAMVQQWSAALAPKLNHISGLWIEDKGLSLAVHYRRCTHRAAVHRQILAQARRLPHVRVFGGKMVVNVVSEDAPHKGDAVSKERDRLDCKWILYVGDDVNDEDAFALRGNVVAVRIGRARHSHADYYLKAQSEIDDLLNLLILLRREDSVEPLARAIGPEMASHGRDR